MNQQKKQEVIESLKHDFSRSKAAFLVGIQGLTVSQLQALRGAIRKESGKMHVAKNTLAHISVKDMSGLSDLQPYFKKQIAVVFAMQDSSAVAKALCDYSKTNEKFSIVAGSFESRIINQEMIKFLGSLPPREVLAAQLCGTLKAPIAKNVFVMNQLIVRLLWVLKQAASRE